MDGELATASEKESEVIDPSPAIVTRNLSELFLTGKFQGIRLASFIPDEVICIEFQHGPLENGVNGCSIEDVIDVLIDRLEGFHARTQ